MSKSECLNNSSMSNDEMMKSSFDGVRSKANLSDFELVMKLIPHSETVMSIETEKAD